MISLLWAALGAMVGTCQPIVGDVRRPAPGEVLPGYELVWADEFEGRTLDETKWAHRALGPRRDAVNVPDAVTLDGDGHLLITTSRRETGARVEYDTGMIGTQGLFETTYGYFETRMRLQKEVGHWSAFWLQTPTMGSNIGDPARAGAEIDVIECLCDPEHREKALHTVHWDGYGEAHKSAHAEQPVSGLHEGWHTFGVLWTPEEYIFYVDGEETWRTTSGVSNRPEFIILSDEVGTWAGDIAEATLPDSVMFDYVRVFKEAGE